MVRVRNSDTGGEADVPESAVPMLAQSGWSIVPKKEVAKAEQVAAEEAAAADKAMTEAGLAAIPSEDRPTEENTPAAQAEGKSA